MKQFYIIMLKISLAISPIIQLLSKYSPENKNN